jgi:16S rRNA (guanine1207-N2)-methyltransferase
VHHGAGIAVVADPAAPRGDRLALAHASGDMHLPPAGTILVLRAEPSALYRALGVDRFHCEQSFRPARDRLAAAGLAVCDPPGASTDRDDADAPPDAPAAAAIVTATRQRAESLGLIARALARVAPGARVVVNGAKADGVDGLMRQVAAAIPLAGSFPKAHGKLFWFARPEALPEAVEGWADGYALRPNDDGFITGPGMFSPDHVDPGSRRLAAVFDARLLGRVADLGAGWGWLAARALAGSPAITALDLHEAEARALAAARCNVTDPRAAFHWSDVARLDRPREGYDWIVTNPPFHQGRAAEPALGATFIAAAARLLKPSGRLLLVANRALPYEAVLSRAFARHDTLTEDAAYKVIEASHPRKVR